MLVCMGQQGVEGRRIPFRISSLLTAALYEGRFQPGGEGFRREFVFA